MRDAQKGENVADRRNLRSDGRHKDSSRGTDRPGSKYAERPRRIGYCFGPTEYLGFNGKDVNSNAGSITILRAMLFNRKGGGWYFKEPKTPESTRSIPIPRHLASQLKHHRSEQLERRLKAGETVSEL
jgi:hypothetical protein